MALAPDHADPGELLPARTATRLTFAMAVGLTVLLTLVDIGTPGGILALYWVLTVVAGVLAYGVRVPERALAAYVCVSWTLAGIGALAQLGAQGGGLPILITAVALIGLFFGGRVALGTVAALTVAIAAIEYAASRGSLPPPPPMTDSARWMITVVFATVAGKIALVQAAVLRKVRSATERALHFALAVERSESSVVITGPDRRAVWVNDAFVKLTGYDLGAIIGVNPGGLLQGPGTLPADRAAMRAHLAAAEPFTREIVNYHRTGAPYWVRVEVRPFFDAKGVLAGFTGVQNDVTAARLRAELDATGRALAEGLAEARRDVDADAALVKALSSVSCLLSTRVWRAGEIVAQGVGPGLRVAGDELERSLGGEPPSPEVSVDGRPVVSTEARGDRPVRHTRAWARGGVARVVDVALSLDMPGRDAVVAGLADIAQQLAHHELRRAERARFELLFDQAPDALLLVDGAGRTVQRNERAAALWPALREGDAVEGGPAELAAAAGAVARGEAPPPVVAWAHAVGGVPVVDLEARVAPIDLAVGRGVLISARDVSTRRAAERALEATLGELRRSLAEREVLLKEVHHRVKNNLQIVSSLLSMQADRSSDDRVQRVLGESVHRVRSLALVHQMLYAGADLARVDLGEYARTMTAELRAAYDVDAQVEVRAGSAGVSIEQAIPCGLVLNELIINALKHGRSADGTCRLQIEVTLAEGRARLSVGDQGPGLAPDFATRRRGSLGMKIIDALTKQLRAKLEMSSEGGARFVLSFAVDA